MGRDRNRARVKRTAAMRVLEERRVLLERLLALESGTPFEDPERMSGHNSRRADLIEEVQETIEKQHALAVRRTLLGRLKVLARAEAKIRAGTYGRCDVCGGSIPPPRLLAVPEAAHCFRCVEEIERRSSPFPPAAG